MAELKVLWLPAGSYERYRQDRMEQGAAAAQVKDLLLARSPETWNALMQAAGRPQTEVRDE